MGRRYEDSGPTGRWAIRRPRPGACRFTEEEIRDSSARLKGAMNLVILLWHNNLRYASEASLRAFLRQSGRIRGVKGDPHYKII
jgi:hypothetical protein